MATAAPTPSPTIDLGRAFTFVTEDPEWVTKVLVGGLFALLSAILVGIPFVLGYWGRTLGNVAAGRPRPLPAWDDLGGAEVAQPIDLSNEPNQVPNKEPDKDIIWGTNAADMAYILFRVPVMVAVHADDMLE